jgi:RIO kinase 1
MNKINPHLYNEDEFEPAPAKVLRKARRSQHAVTDEALRYTGKTAVADEEAFRPTYQGARFEREWILTYLGYFYDQRLLTDVLRRVKGGKEANVYCCAGDAAAGQALLAAKLYRPRMLRNLRNDARYRQGRAYLDEFGKTVNRGLEVAIRKGTAVGKAAAHTSWLEHEHRALEVLYGAGVSVPRPLAVGENAILMEYIGDLDLPAPTLHEVHLSVRRARAVFDSLVNDLEKMLAAGCVHGDLSAYNVLYWQERGRIIDLPQVVHPRNNGDAWDIFQRDVARLCEYFQRYGLARKPAQLAADLWDRYAYPHGPEEPLPEEDEEPI